MSGPLVVNVAELLRRPGSTRELAATVDAADLLDGDAVAAADVAARPPDAAQIDVRLRLEALSDGIVVEGTLTTPWVGVCRRCLGAARGAVVSEVRELYQRVPTDPDAFPLPDDQLDLRTLVRELVVLDVPSAPLCRDDCAGLCPTCGTDRNAGTCGCATPTTDPRWAALDALRGADGPAD